MRRSNRQTAIVQKPVLRYQNRSTTLDAVPANGPVQWGPYVFATLFAANVANRGSPCKCELLVDGYIGGLYFK